MIILYYLIAFIITLIFKRSKFLYFTILLPYFYIIFIGRSFNELDDMFAYHQAYLSGEYKIQFGFLEFALPQIFTLLNVFNIENIYQFNITMVILETLFIFFILVKDKHKFLIFLTTICSAPFIINSGLYIRQFFSSIIIIYGILYFKNNYYYLASTIFHNTSVIYYLINRVSKFIFFKKNFYIVLIIFILAYFFQPLNLNFFLYIFNFFSYDKIHLWENSDFDINRLPFTSFLMPYFFLFYVFFKKNQNGLFSFSIFLIIIIFLFGTIPFLASRLGLIPIVFTPYLLYDKSKPNNLDLLGYSMLLIYFIYTTAVFIYKDQSFYYSIFKGIYSF